MTLCACAISIQITVYSDNIVIWMKTSGGGSNKSEDDYIWSHTYKCRTKWLVAFSVKL